MQRLRSARRAADAACGSIALLLLLAAAAAPAAAATCADTPVSARGDPASYQWLALIKARGDWRSKVRGLPELGPRYANWATSTDQVERCIKDGRSVRCIVTARPCRS